MAKADLGRLREVLDALAAPFPLEALGAKPAASNKDKTSVLAVAYVDARAVVDRLNTVVPLWEDRYTILATPQKEGDPYVVECTLIIYPSPGGEGISRSDVGEGETLKAAYSDALKRAAVKFGVGRYLYRLEKQWVDYDPEKGRFTPPKLPETEPEAEGEEKPEAHRLIDQLLERLKEKGLGKEAAQIVNKYGGYGKTPEETRKLYGELRNLLKG